MPTSRDTPARRAARLRSRTWGEIKQMIESQGVTDDDAIFSIDIGPYADRVTIDRAIEGVEVEDDSSEILDR